MRRPFWDHFEGKHTRKWTAVFGSPAVVPTSPGIGYGNSVLELSQNDFVEKQFSSSVSESWIGFDFRTGNLSLNYRDVNAPNEYFFGWADNVTFLMRLAISDVTRLMTLYLGTGASKIAQGSFIFSNNVQYHLQIRYKIADSGGSIQVRVNDNLDLSYDNQDTKPGSETNYNKFRIFSPNSGGFPTYVDNIVLNDPNGGINDSWPGIVRFTSGVVPTGDSTVNNAFSKSAGSDGYALVDESPPNDDTDYVYSITNGQKQGHTFPAVTLPANATLLAFVDEHMLRKDTGGQADPGFRFSGNESFKGTEDVGTSYGVTEYRLATRPGGGAWQNSDNPESIIKAVIV